MDSARMLLFIDFLGKATLRRRIHAQPVLLALFLLFVVHLPASAQSLNVRFYPLPELTHCKKCKYLKKDYWTLKYRLENHTPDDLIVYGARQKTAFEFISRAQFLNSDICEWQYAYGSADNRGGWKSLSDYYKKKIILKAGESIEMNVTDVSGDGVSIPRRFVAFIARAGDIEPLEVFSEPYFAIAAPASSDKPGDAKIPIPPEIRIYDNKTCSPLCTLSLEQSPRILGIRLGMSLEEFKTLFPNANVHKETGYELKYVSLWNWNEDAFSTYVTFLDDVVIRIETQLKSLEGKRFEKNFYAMVGEKLGLPVFGTGYRSRFECRDFLVEVLTNEVPTITIWNKSGQVIHGKIVEETYRKKKKKKK